MEIHIYNQHNIVRAYCPCVCQSFFSPLSGSCKSFLKRGKFQKNYIVNTATPSQARRASKSNFIEPKWMLPTDDKATHQTSSTSFFQVILTTSKDYGSGISDLNAGVLLAFIGEQGRSFVHRIPTLVSTEKVETSEQPQELCASKASHYRFQRGLQDVVTFSGPDLGKLEAVWVAPEKSTWRINDLRVRVFPEQLHEDERNIIENTDCKVLQYDFVCEEFLMGENDNNLAAEFKPYKVSEIAYNDRCFSGSNSMADQLQVASDQLRDEGIREYEALKFSLLGYDALLVTLGSIVAALMGYNEVAEGYLVGGVLGFLYLFVLEKAVDQLPAPSSSLSSVTDDRESSLKDNAEMVERRSVAEIKGNGMSLSGNSSGLDGFRGPLTKFSGVLAVCLLIAKSLSDTNSQAISKQMLLAGAAGFVMTKFATILASNVPLPLQQAPPSEKEG